MKNRKRATIIGESKTFSLLLRLCIFSFLLAVSACPVCLAVTSKVTRHSSSADLLKGQTEDVVIDSKGTLQLGRAAETLVKEFEGVGEKPGAEKTASQPW